MYSKTGLSALAIAGTTFGVIGMLIGAGGAATPADCRAPSSGVTAPATGGINDARNTPTSQPADKGKTAAKKPGSKGTKPHTTTPSAGNNGSNGSNGSGGSGSSNLIDIDGRTNTPDDNGVHVAVPSDGTAPSVGTDGSSASDLPFLDLQGNTAGVDATDGTATVPPTGTRVIGRSNTLGRLIHVTGRANTR